MDDDITRCITDLLQEKGRIPVADVGSYNYVDSGHIDSLGLIKFFIRLEEKFDVDITPADIANRDIRTVAGLAALIERKLGRQP